MAGRRMSGLCPVFDIDRNVIKAGSFCYIRKEKYMSAKNPVAIAPDSPLGKARAALVEATNQHREAQAFLDRLTATLQVLTNDLAATEQRLNQPASLIQPNMELESQVLAQRQAITRRKAVLTQYQGRVDSAIVQVQTAQLEVRRLETSVQQALTDLEQLPRRGLPVEEHTARKAARLRAIGGAIGMRLDVLEQLDMPALRTLL
jgi:chromosome segregation ATPase